MADNNKRYIGIVKWFNSKSGYGFLSTVNHEEPQIDLFVHITNLRVSQPMYKTLYNGEYVEFRIENNLETTKNQAVDVSGVQSHPLMCETNFNNRRLKTEQ